MASESSIIRLLLVGIAVISWLFYLSFSPIAYKELKMICLLVLFGVLFYSTHFLYESDALRQRLYIGQFLRWGADCTSACAIGMSLMKLKDYKVIHKILPWEGIALTPFMSIACLTLGIKEGQMHLEGGMNYQTVAYSMAILFCLSLFYTFIYNRHSGRLKKLFFLSAMLIQAVCCAMAGGRGGLVLLVAYVIYMSYYLLRNKILSAKKLLLIGFFIVIVFLFLATQLGLWESAGFNRSSNAIHDTDRLQMWKGIWNYVKANNYLGYGLGGDYFTFGFYTHNIILDFILELGIFGLLIMSYCFWQTYKRLFILSKSNEIFVIIMIFFIYGVVMNMFSGYWVSTSSNWMAFGVAYTMENYYKCHRSRKSLI